METEFLVSKIRSGTVIDHIPASHATKILYVLGLPSGASDTMAVLMNARSSLLGRKDVVKVEGKRLTAEEMKLLALIAPDATVNIIEDYKVVEKRRAALPDRIEGVLKCNNVACITNNDVEARGEFSVTSRSPLSLECSYCMSKLVEGDILAQVSSMPPR